MVDSIKNLNKYAKSGTVNGTDLTDQFSNSLDDARNKIDLKKGLLEIDRYILSGQLTYELASGSFDNDQQGFIQKVEDMTGKSFSENGNYDDVDLQAVSGAYIKLLEGK